MLATGILPSISSAKDNTEDINVSMGNLAIYSPTNFNNVDFANAGTTVHIGNETV